MNESVERRLPAIDVSAFSAPAPAPAPPTLRSAPSPAASKERKAKAPVERPAGEGSPRSTKGAPAVPELKLITVGVKVAATTRELLRAAAAAEASLTQTGVMLGAIAATRTKLPAEFERPGAEAGPFETATAVRRRRHAEPWVQVSLRITEKDLKVIDEIARECSAPDRSRMIDTALRLHLS